MIFKKSIVFFSALALTFSLASCEEDLSTDNNAANYVGLENYQTVEVADGQTVVVEGRILATNVSNVDRTFNLVVDPSTNHSAGNYTVPATVTIPAGSKEGTYDVTVIGNNLVDGNKIVVSLEPSADLNQNTSYGTFTNGVLTGVTTSKSTFNLYRPCASVRARLSIKFDSYPDETAWELYDSNLNLVDYGGFSGPGGSFVGLGTFAPRSTFSVVKCLTPGEYTFVIYDAYGDGMYTSSTVIGNYSMNNLNNGAPLFSGQGNFGSFAEHTFIIQ
ncbi:hypothetical protein NAT47_01735 [Flavobacterium sp. HXWNR69]|uniref:Uncharacterized protein n=1 Tax=Flavobacterium fragile TaxID=2949085 RepID=A0ABT0TDV0_9FLAO|nr:hypothetical protein [Flavobacterium sp. HXWNR69]MCL9769129.1 hypothetical protein [Flavobacterium sp. HXWNR69]